MVQAAPRLDRRLLAALAKLETSSSSYAEIRRALVAQARELGLPPPSYEHVRRLVIARRAEREAAGPELSDVALDVVFRVRPPQALVEAIAERASRHDGSRPK